MVRTIYQPLSPAEVRGQSDRVMEQLLKPFPQVAELLVGAVLAKQHDEWAEARPKGKSGGTKFAQGLLRNAGQLVCIDPSLGMAEFRYKSAIFCALGWFPPRWTGNDGPS